MSQQIQKTPLSGFTDSFKETPTKSMLSNGSSSSTSSEASMFSSMGFWVIVILLAIALYVYLVKPPMIMQLINHIQDKIRAQTIKTALKTTDVATDVVESVGTNVGQTVSEAVAHLKDDDDSSSIQGQSVDKSKQIHTNLKEINNELKEHAGQVKYQFKHEDQDQDTDYRPGNLNNFPPKLQERGPDSYVPDKGIKSGWCYVGDSDDRRTCVQVGEMDACMSGDIFPSQDYCVNPKLMGHK